MAPADHALRDALAAVAALGLKRKAGPDRPWASAAGAEEDLLARARALAGTGGEALVERLAALPIASGFTLGATALQASRAAPGQPASLDASGAFARALVLGSAEPADAISADAAAGILLEARPEARAACTEALALAPSVAVGPAVARLLDDAPAASCTAALRVLRVRRQVPYAVALPFLAHPEFEVAGAAARALGAGPSRASAAAVLRHVLGGEPADPLAVTVAEVLLMLGDPAGLGYVRARLSAESDAPSLADEVRVAYLRLLALGGDASDTDLFLRSVEPTPRDAEPVGWFGHPDLVDWLLEALEGANEGRRARGQGAPSLFETAAARALHRILGVPGAPRPAGPSARETLVLDAGPWRSHWHAERARAGASRLRFGRPYTPSATLDELEGETLPPLREHAALELAVVSRGAVLLETGDWVFRQRAALAAARASLGAPDAWVPGAFPGAPRESDDLPPEISE
jgi:hypothetical protein